MTWDPLYAWARGRTPRPDYMKALIPLALAAAFYTFIAKSGRNGEWVLATLLYPGFVLVAGRLHDMGYSAWILLAPGLLDAAALGLHFYPGLAPAMTTAAVGVAAYAVSLAFLLWGLAARGQAAPNRFGEPAAAWDKGPRASAGPF